MAEVHIGYFLEDIAHENFIKATVMRVAKEMHFSMDQLRHDVRSNTGGHGRAIEKLRLFFRDCQRSITGPFDLLVVAIDLDCKRFTVGQNEIQQIANNMSYGGSIAVALPDPHIERWYLLDPQGFREAIGTGKTPNVPPYRCERDYYKQALSSALKELDPPLGGVEFAEDIVAHMNFYQSGRSDTSFRHFIDGVQQGLRPFLPGP